jgi:hypothetical protein
MEHKNDFLWRNYLQTESDINQSYELNDDDKSIKLKDSFLKAHARKAEEIFLKKLQKRQSMAQMI